MTRCCEVVRKKKSIIKGKNNKGLKCIRPNGLAKLAVKYDVTKEITNVDVKKWRRD